MDKPFGSTGAKGLLLFVCLVFLLGGCANLSGISAGQIIPPPNSVDPFGGKWIVLQVLDTESAETERENWENSSVQFSSDIIAFGGQMWDNLSYKIKKVDKAAYLTEKDALDIGVFVEDYSKTDVVTIYTSDSYLGEFLKIDDSNMVFFVQNNVLFLQKISDQPDAMLREIYTKAQEQGDSKDAGISGVLIGLRSPAAGGYTYRTVWIASDHDKLRSVLFSEHLFFPRTSGFWECKVLDVDVDGEQGNVLTAQSAFAKEPREEQEVTASDATVSGRTVSEGADEDSDEGGSDSEGGDSQSTAPTTQIIHYIGNDYVSVESISREIRRLHVLPVDTLSSPINIKVGDLLGNDGWAVFSNARKEDLQALEMERIEDIEEDDAGENFGLVRDKGHWKLMGRVNYFHKGRPFYSDFELKVIPPYSLIYYDTLAVNWNNIKDRVPDAQDAFTSPDRNIALVKTKNRLGIYAIGTEKLSESLLGEIELFEGETIIMAEWAMAIYVDSWERAFLAYGAKVL